jgi:hypothetical protein
LGEGGISNFHEIKLMLSFLVENVGKASSQRLQDEKQVYANKSPALASIYESLMNKYLLSSKTKEEKIKFVLRKSFKYMKDKITSKDDMSKKDIEKLFFEVYFNDEDIMNVNNNSSATTNNEGSNSSKNELGENNQMIIESQPLLPDSINNNNNSNNNNNG